MSNDNRNKHDGISLEGFDISVREILADESIPPNYQTIVNGYNGAFTVYGVASLICDNHHYSHCEAFRGRKQCVH